MWNTRLLIEALKYLPKDASSGLQHLILETQLQHLKERPEDLKSDFISHILIVSLDTMQVIEDKRFEEIVDLSLRELANRIQKHEGLSLAAINPIVEALNPVIFKYDPEKGIQLSPTEATMEFAKAILSKETGQSRVTVHTTEFIKAHGLDISDRLENFQANMHSFSEQPQYRMMILQGVSANVEVKSAILSNMSMRFLKYALESPFAGQDPHRLSLLARVGSVNPVQAYEFTKA